MYIEIASNDRAAVERQILEHLWAEKTVRLTTDRDGDRYLVTLSTSGSEPDGKDAALTPLS